MLFAPILALSMGQVYAQVPQPWREPGYLKVIWVDSPNFNERPVDAVIDTIVVHHTANDSLEGTCKWFNMKESQVSAHYTIGKDGSIVQHVSTWKRSWHAGVSLGPDGRENLNHFSIGIELVNIGDGTQSYPIPQTNALYFLIESLKRRYALTTITSHKFIAVPVGRKIDPINFPWERLEGLGLKVVP